MKDLFQLQTELIDTKVDMAVNKAIDRVITEIHDLRSDMNQRFSSLEQRMTVVETKLGIVNETQREIRTRFIDYSFKAGWLILGVALSYLIMQLH